MTAQPQRMPWKYPAVSIGVLLALGSKQAANLTNAIGFIVYFGTLVALGYFLAWLIWRTKRK